MNGWLTAASGMLLLGLGPTLCGTFTGPARRRVLAQNLAGLLAALTVLLMAQGYARPAYADLALALAVLGPTGTLVYQRLLAEELTARPPGARSTRAVTAVGAVLVPLVVVPVCVATPPGRATAKTLVIGLLLLAGNLVCTRALAAPPGPASGGSPAASHRSGPASGGPSGEERSVD